MAVQQVMTELVSKRKVDAALGGDRAVVDNAPLAVSIRMRQQHSLELCRQVKTEFRERGKLKKASRIELSIRRFAALATKGDVASAAWLLKMRAHAKKYGDSGPTIIRVAGGFPEAFR
jgi:nitrogen fixation protein FixH